MSGGNWDRELRVLEQALRRLSAECDAFLYGSATKPPLEARRHVEEMLRTLNASDSMSAAERYRFSALQGRFSVLTERWERLLAEKEAGRRPGLYGHFRPGGGAPPPPTPAGPTPYKKSGTPFRPTWIETCSIGTSRPRRRGERT